MINKNYSNLAQGLKLAFRIVFLSVLCWQSSLLLNAKKARDADKLDGHDWQEVQQIINNTKKLKAELQSVVGTVSQLKNKSSASVGDYKFSSNAKDHDGWLLCDGRKLLSRDYQKLFKVIQCNFSQGVDCNAKASATFFKLPDPRGRVAGVSGQGAGLTKRSTGQKAGEEKHKLTANEMPRHGHGTHSHGTHAHGNHSHGSHSHGTHAHGNHSHGSHSHGTHAHGYQDMYFSEAWGQVAVPGNIGGNTGVDSDNKGYQMGRLTDARSVPASGVPQSGVPASGVPASGVPQSGVPASGVPAASVPISGGDQAHNVMQPTLFVGNLFIYAGK